MPYILIFLIIILSAFSSYPQIKTMGAKMDIRVESSAFKNGESIPAKYTIDGENISPPLKWNIVSEKIKSYALINDDPDAPIGDWVHWVLYNIPPAVTELKENTPNVKSFPNGAIHGTNDFNKTGYGGPTPPSGTHRYYFKIYALDTMLKLEPGAAKAKLLKAMQGHIIAQGQLIGLYKRK